MSEHERDSPPSTANGGRRACLFITEARKLEAIGLGIRRAKEAYKTDVRDGGLHLSGRQRPEWAEGDSWQQNRKSMVDATRIETTRRCVHALCRKPSFRVQILRKTHFNLRLLETSNCISPAAGEPVLHLTCALQAEFYSDLP